MKLFKSMMALAASLFPAKAAVPAPQVSHDHVYHVHPSAPAAKATRPRWDMATPKKRKASGKAVAVDLNAIVKNSRPSGRKPSRTQRRATQRQAEVK